MTLARHVIYLFYFIIYKILLIKFIVRSSYLKVTLNDYGLLLFVTGHHIWWFKVSSNMLCENVHFSTFVGNLPNSFLLDYPGFQGKQFQFPQVYPSWEFYFTVKSKQTFFLPCAESWNIKEVAVLVKVPSSFFFCFYQQEKDREDSVHLNCSKVSLFPNTPLLTAE